MVWLEGFFKTFILETRFPLPCQDRFTLRSARVSSSRVLLKSVRKVPGDAVGRLRMALGWLGEALGAVLNAFFDIGGTS